MSEVDNDVRTQPRYLNCPFAIKIGRTRITCEGFMGSRTITLSFPDERKCTEVVTQFCANSTRVQSYRRCPIAVTLEKEYGV